MYQPLDKALKMFLKGCMHCLVCSFMSSNFLLMSSNFF